MNKEFDIPVVLFVFRRTDTIGAIMNVVSQVRPKKLYILSDEGRNDEEKAQVKVCRDTIEQLVNWKCELVKNYASENRGVYGNIGLGAKWVFEREENAIFLEDDNLPDISFFNYCKELLDKYKSDPRILWICGTNYLGEYRNERNESYMFTRNLLPCGWASWADKFLSTYEFGFKSVKTEKDLEKIKESYITNALYLQEYNSILSEYKRGCNGEQYRSWDYHMIYSVRKNGLFGISPAVNLINNIGVDMISEHGGNTLQNVMTSRFCNIPEKKIENTLVHPQLIGVDTKYEKRIEKIITYPFKQRISGIVARILRRMFSIPDNVHTKEYFLKRKR